MHASRFRDVPPITNFEPNLPHRVVILINRLMELDPERRIQTPSLAHAEIELVRKAIESGDIQIYDPELARQQAADYAQALAIKEEGRDKTILLVEANPKVQDLFREKLKELGYDLGENALEDAFNRFKDLADRKKFVYDEDLIAVVDDEIVNSHDHIKVISLMVMAGTQGPQSAALTLDIDGKRVTHQATGNGPVDAIFNAIKALAPHEAILELFQVHAVTEGTDAQAEVSVRLNEDGKSVTGRGADPDTLVAAARAYIAALNKLVLKRSRGKPEAMQAM
jgi:CheY-like chemotaxis protein